ncbi:MAG: GNAT family N-acetyltransferase [Candidatus Latescibacteria bacterium]|jgi:GNAT superfamily N-acetyltransferase|nr:GNAT family N-acetyltransferase [Gemmatimonadaceae bacterium]MDP6016103.1 GNAT family N-acetyltransferase [Candidatus Latescibacterota bacterium]MDP7450460.1 GNAT family N-acetyltransferase [Candidatus Latescibacterota bacterium]HJP30997.1 GNAT family N-acetyltransferase [Candidatus Latescibacterota bacterium]|tara:strand:+ start:227 stop:733 length:507 start_codon:yes stop_codon:yes gene_type:complete
MTEDAPPSGRDLHLHEWTRDTGDETYLISTDRARLDVDMIHEFLTHSYWSPGIPREVVIRGIEHSFCFGLYRAESQIGFARAITDYTSMAYLADVFVLPGHRGQGLGKWLVQCIVDCPSLKGLRTMSLATADAHELYRCFGFEGLVSPEAHMSRKQEMDWFRPEQVRE